MANEPDIDERATAESGVTNWLTGKSGVDDRSNATRWGQQAMAFTVRYLREMSRNKVSVFWAIGFPGIWYLLTVHLQITPGVGHEGTATIKAILGITFGVFAAFTVTLVGFAGDLAVDIDDKRYRKFRSLPLYPSADLVGRFASGILLGFVSFLFILVLSSLDGAVYQIRGAISLPVVVTSLLLFCIIGMISGLLVVMVTPRPEFASTIGTGILMIGFFVTGYNGTFTLMFPARKFLLNIIPNSLSTRIIVYHLVDTDWSQAGMVPPNMPGTGRFLLLLVAYAALFSSIGVLLMRRRIYQGEVGE